MSPEIVGVIGIVIMLVLLFLRMWIALAMALVGFIGIVYLQGWTQALLVTGTVPFTFIYKYSLTTLPMFVLMGNIIAETGIGADLYYAANRWVGHLKGGLAIATNFASAMLGAITGVSSVALVTMAKIALPEMRKYNYSDTLATGSIACSGTLAFMIPPSVAFILYGILTEQSIGMLYMAGIIPGVILAVLFTITILIIARVKPEMAPPGPKSTLKEKLLSLKGLWATLVLFVLVLGGIYGGIFTPTEAGAVGAGGALVIALASRKLTRQGFIRSMIDTGLMTSMVLLLMMGVSIFIKFLAISKLPFMMSASISALNLHPIVVFVIIVIIYIILGMFTDIIASIVLTVPILFPIILNLGFDPIWFGVVVVLVIEMGLVTPPIGLDVFILGGLSGVPVGTIFRGVWPFVIAILICLIIVTAFPEVAMFIPNTMK